MPDLLFAIPFHINIFKYSISFTPLSTGHVYREGSGSTIISGMLRKKVLSVVPS